MNNYHVVLTEGEERNVRAKDAEFHSNGSVSFINERGERVITYATGRWVLVEKETRDDTGQ